MAAISTPDAAQAWAPYCPDANDSWSLRRVIHLHRRAGFAASWNELQRDLTEGPEASITRLLNGQARGPREGVPEQFQAIAALLGDAAVASNEPARLKAWWLYRILFTPDPLGEKL